MTYSGTTKRMMSPEDESQQSQLNTAEGIFAASPSLFQMIR